MKLSAFLFVVLFTTTAVAQKSQLALDEHNKYIFYQVIELPDKTEETLSKSTLEFIAGEYPKNRTISKGNDNSIKLTDKFLTYATLTRHASGEINYTLTIENKPGKYRYWITGFKFTPYQRDRYSNFVPRAGLNYPLEDASKFDKKEIDNYLNQTALICEALGEKLKQYMTGALAQKKEEITKKVVTDKW